jgi:hypothetical protein
MKHMTYNVNFATRSLPELHYILIIQRPLHLMRGKIEYDKGACAV